MNHAEKLDSVRDEVVAMLSAKASFGMIATTHGVSRSAVAGWLNRRKITAGPKPKPDRASINDARDDVLRRYADAVDKPRFVRVVAARYALSIFETRAWFARNGVPMREEECREQAPPVKTAPLPAALAAPAQRRGVPFLDASLEQCRFPLWSIHEKSGDVCGEPVMAKTVRGKRMLSSWCAACATRVHPPREAHAA